MIRDVAANISLLVAIDLVVLILPSPWMILGAVDQVEAVVALRSPLFLLVLGLRDLLVATS